MEIIKKGMSSEEQKVLKHRLLWDNTMQEALDKEYNNNLLECTNRFCHCLFKYAVNDAQRDVGTRGLHTIRCPQCSKEICINSSDIKHASIQDLTPKELEYFTNLTNQKVKEKENANT